MTFEYAYRQWNLYRSEPGEFERMKILATRGGIENVKSPTVHKEFMEGNETGESVARIYVQKKIDQIEDEGFEAYMDREFPEWRNEIG